MLKSILLKLRAPLRFLIVIFRLSTGRGMIVKFYMRSGNVVTVNLKKYDIKNGEATWINALNGKGKLSYIDISEIEAIVHV